MRSTAAIWLERAYAMPSPPGSRPPCPPRSPHLVPSLRGLMCRLSCCLRLVILEDRYFSRILMSRVLLLPVPEARASPGQPHLEVARMNLFTVQPYGKPSQKWKVKNASQIHPHSSGEILDEESSRVLTQS